MTDPKSKEAQEQHNRGQRDGADASVIDELLWVFNPFTRKEYDEGFENGLKNQSEKK